jgi:hypothetical protein
LPSILYVYESIRGSLTACEHRAYLELGYDKLMDRARAIGPRTADVLAKLALSKKHLDEVMRGALGILRLADDFTPAALENACVIAMQFGVYTYRAVRDLLVQSLSKGTKRARAQPPPISSTRTCGVRRTTAIKLNTKG